MIIDTSGSSFDKVAMDIVRLLSKTEKGNEYSNITGSAN